MIDLDHEKTRGNPFCPLMGECCSNGMTKKMKGNKCAAWRSLPMHDIKTNLTQKVYACSVYEWPLALGYEQSTFLQQSRASTDKVATEVKKHHATFFGALNDESKQRLMDADPRLNIEHKNGNKEN